MPTFAPTPEFDGIAMEGIPTRTNLSMNIERRMKTRIAFVVQRLLFGVAGLAFLVTGSVQAALLPADPISMNDESAIVITPWVIIPMFLASILSFGSAFLWSARRNKWLEDGRDPMIGVEGALILPLQGILALDLERASLMDITTVVYIFGTVGLFWVLHAFANGADEDSAWRGRTATRIAPALATIVPGVTLLSLWAVAGDVASTGITVVRGVLWVSCALVSTLLGLSVTVTSARTYWRYNTAMHVCFIVSRITIAAVARPDMYVRVE